MRPTPTMAAVTTETDLDDAGLVWCFQCGNEYDEEVETCTECGVPTTDQRPTQAADVGAVEDDQLAYEFHEWTGQGRSTLDGMLTRLDIEHAWQGATLIIREEDEDAVDAAVVEAEVVAMPTLDLTQPTVIYEIDELDDDQNGRLLRRMEQQGLSHAFDRKGDLFVYQKDEEKVDEIFGGLDEADLSEREFGPGIDGDPLAVMSDLFVAVGRLKKRPGDQRGVLSFVESAGLIEQMRLPYGIAADVWADVVDRTAELHEVLTGEDGYNDVELAEMSGELHSRLRKMV